jgi:hypothetical protein
MLNQFMRRLGIPLVNQHHSALVLVLLKENSDQEETGRKIRSVLVPVEYTRVDALVDVVFAAASDVDNELSESVVAQPVTEPFELVSAEPPADRSHIHKTREEILRAMSSLLEKPLVKKSRAMWWSSDHASRIACTISKRYESGHDYWYAFHPSWQKFLEEGQKSFFVLGCADLDRAFAIPINELLPLLPHFNISETERGMYWHIQLNLDHAGQVRLTVPRQTPVDLERYAVGLKSN